MLKESAPNRNPRSTVLLAILLACSALPLEAQRDAPVYRDPDRHVDTRVADLLGRMTLEEKVAQLVGLWDDKVLLMDEQGVFVPEKAALVIPHGVGQITRPSDRWGQSIPGVTPTRTPSETVELVNAIQRYLLEDTRLGIPAMMHEEGLHGFQARDATVFPQAIALAGTFDPSLAERVYEIVAREIRARGAALVLSPVVDVARDPRWGRIEETYGEDPHLVSEMGLAAVRGFQGRRAQGDPLAPGRVFATLKHMTGHGEPESGNNVAPANISERILREVFFPPFERAVKEAAAANVMASYNEIDGIPSHANRWLISDVLRGEWGFEGSVVADYNAIAELERRHSVASSLEEAALLALEAGVDIELPNPTAYPHLLEAVRGGRVAPELIDRSVARGLRAKFLAGLFEDPYADAAAAEAITGNAQARELALEAAEKSIVLLQNEGGLLPLDLANLDTIAVIGPNAAETIMGGYTDVPRQTVSLLDGIRARVGGSVKVEFAQGVRITKERNWWGDEVTLADPEENRRLIAEAVEVARRADVIVVAVGDNEQTSREAWAETHLGDRTRLDLVGEQDELVRTLVETGVPTVVVLIHGRPLAVTEIAARVPAIVDAWYLGQETGTALARALFGDINPGAKLAVTIPRSVGQVPIYYNHKPTARRGYLFGSAEPLWPFGFGLSYTTFEIGVPRLGRTEIGSGERTTLSVDVTNTGKRRGDEVVQLYIRDRVSSVTRPVKELKGFSRITVEPGATATVMFSIGPEQLRFFDRSMNRVVEPGEFELMVGSDSANLESVVLAVADR